MPKINPDFPHSIFDFLHKPIRDLDKAKGNDFVQRLLIGPQQQFEDMQARIKEIETLNDPAKIRADLLQFLKDIVGFTRELNNITNDLGENDLRKLISLAVALWKTKGIEPGYANIIRIFTGKTARIFNWFDFRFIVGEKAFGEEQLGEDSWFISLPGIEASEDTSNIVIALFPFEANALDRSLTRNHAILKGSHQFYTPPAAGFPQNSTKYLFLNGGVLEVNNSSKYDLSGDFTIEIWYRSKDTETNKTMIHKMDASGKGFKIEIDKSANSISFEIGDGTNVVSGSFTPAANLDGNLPLHTALVLDRAKDGARLYVGGTESSAKIALGALGNVTNSAKMFVGGEGVGINNLKGDYDSFRLALNAAYDVDTGSLTIPIPGFIEFIEEQLDEFKTDIRIVDEGDLNKTLILRILNLMRPVSERINVIFIRFFDDFLDGIGQFEVPQGMAAVNTNIQMEIQPNTIVNTAVLGDDDFQDIVLQVKANDTLQTGGVYSVLFFFQDVDNYYEFRIDTINRETSLHKVVASVPSVISAAVVEDIVPKASYILTVITDKSESSGDTLIKAFVDSNKQHQVIDSSFDKGKFGMKTDGSTIMQIDEIEMLEVPFDIQKVEPGFDL